MAERAFLIGDRVRYKSEKTGKSFNLNWAGKEGVISGYTDNDYLVDYKEVKHCFTCSYNLESTELTYNPDQQGDTDDDI